MDLTTTTDAELAMLIEHATTIEARTAARIELARRADADAAPSEGAAFEAGVARVSAAAGMAATSISGLERASFRELESLVAGTNPALRGAAQHELSVRAAVSAAALAERTAERRVAYAAGAALAVRITDDSTGELEWEGPLAVFLADNAHALDGSGLADVDADDLVPGAVIYMGGGAAPTVKVTVVAAGAAR